MRICCVIASLGGGGAERVMTELCRAWSARGDDVTLLTLDDGHADFHAVPAGVTRHALDIAGGTGSMRAALRANLTRLRVLRQAIVTAHPDVVVSFTDRTNVLVLLAARGLRVPLVVSERADPRAHEPGFAWRVLRRITYPVANALVVQTESVRRWSRRVISASRVHVIPNPVRQVPAPRRSAAWRPAVVVALGRLVPQKGFDTLIAAFASASDANPSWQLVIHGEGPERGRLEAIVNAHGMGGRVRLPGRTSSADAVLADASLFVLSSRYEGFPNALLEAMANGCAAISTDCPSGPADMISHDETGLLVPVDDERAIAAALGALMCDPARRARLGQAARASTSRYSTEHVLGLWDRVFDAVARGARRGVRATGCSRSRAAA